MTSFQALNYGLMPTTANVYSYALCGDDNMCMSTSTNYYCRYFNPNNQNANILDPMPSTDLTITSGWNWAKTNRICTIYSHTCTIGNDAPCNLNPPFPYMKGVCKAASTHFSTNVLPSTDCFYDDECTDSTQCNDKSNCVWVQYLRKNVCIPHTYGISHNVNSTTLNNINVSVNTLQHTIQQCDTDMDCYFQNNNVDECKLQTNIIDLTTNTEIYSVGSEMKLAELDYVFMQNYTYYNNTRKQISVYNGCSPSDDCVFFETLGRRKCVPRMNTTSLSGMSLEGFMLLNRAYARSTSKNAELNLNWDLFNDTTAEYINTLGSAFADSGLYCRMNRYLGYRTCGLLSNVCSTSLACPSTSMTCNQFSHTGEPPNYDSSALSYSDCMRPGECRNDNACSLAGQKCTLQNVTSAGLMAEYKVCSCQLSSSGITTGCAPAQVCVNLSFVLNQDPKFFSQYGTKLNSQANVCMCDPSISPNPSCNGGSCFTFTYEAPIRSNTCILGSCTHYSPLPDITTFPVCSGCLTNIASSSYNPNILDCSDTLNTCSKGGNIGDNLHVNTLVNPDANGNFLNLQCMCPVQVGSMFYTEKLSSSSQSYCVPTVNSLLITTKTQQNGLSLLTNTFNTYNTLTSVTDCSNTSPPSILNPNLNTCQSRCPVWSDPSPTSNDQPNYKVCGGNVRGIATEAADGTGCKCVCKPGMFGKACQHLYCQLGVNNQICSGNGKCDTAVGRCICISGWVGFLCSTPFSPFKSQILN